MSLHVYGASDDLIEVEGDLVKEYGCFNAAVVLVLSDGGVYKVEYGKNTATWEIRELVSSSLPRTITPAKDEETDYSDHLRIEGKVEWIRAIRAKDGEVLEG